MYRKLFYVLFAALFFMACGNNSDDKKVKDDLELPGGLTNTNLNAEEQQSMTEIVQNFPAPVEMAALLDEVGAPYSNKYLFPTENADDYNTSFKQSLALGIYSADLGYMNIYSKTTTIVQYLTVIKRLADDLRIGQFFDFQTLKRLAVSNENLDTLMFLSVSSFNEMDDHLRQHNRNHLSALIVTGVWLEGLYLATQVHTTVPNPRIAERIGDQKLLLEDILTILKKYNKDKNFANLIKDLGYIYDAYKGVQIKIIPGEPKMVEQNGTFVIKQNERSEVSITNSEIVEITKRVNEIRNKLISL